jgi:hypothetical protein
MQIILHFLTIFGYFITIPSYFLAYAAQKKRPPEGDRLIPKPLAVITAQPSYRYKSLRTSLPLEPYPPRHGDGM